MANLCRLTRQTRTGLRLNYSTLSKKLQFMKCCKILGISVSSDQEEIRKAYLDLVKKYHPDSGGKEANAEKFLEIDNAFKSLMQLKSEERWSENEVEVQEQDIKHTAPQHRQYLSYGGMGSGTPYQREKQYAKFRAMQATDNVLQHRMSKISAEEGALIDKNTSTPLRAPNKHQIKTKYGFDRLVEDLIQESMSKGEFSNLRGTGKPLPNYESRNPYVDFVTHKLNEVLIDNGFTPEWITLQKEIREEISKLRQSLLSERANFGPLPLSDPERIMWEENIRQKYPKIVEDLNKKIDKFNLVVPILDKQIIQVDLQKEVEQALAKGQHREDNNFFIQPKTTLSKDNIAVHYYGYLFDLIEHLFTKK